MTRHSPPFPRRLSALSKSFWPARLLLCLTLLTCTASSQTVSVEVYQERLGQIQEKIGELADQKEGVLVGLAQLRTSIPPSEDIASEGVRLRVDNRWLIEEIETILEIDPGAPEARTRLNDLEFRLGRLRRLMQTSPKTLPVPDYQLERELLHTIVSGSEYRPEEVRESSVRQWLSRLKESLLSMIRRLIPGSARTGPADVDDQLSRFQKAVLVITIPLAIYLLFRLLSGLRIRRRLSPDTASREILGETITPDLSPTDLLERARLSAQAGEYRHAIRFSFIASILQMAQHDILAVYPSRTNRDYLKALPRGSEILPIFSILTSLFEDFWYGQRTVSAEDYDHFNNLVLLLGREISGRSDTFQPHVTT